MNQSMIKRTIRLILSDKFLFSVTAIWFLFQFVYCTLFSYTELVSDPGFYVYYAEECASRNTMFPDYEYYHNEYIFSPGYINLLILWIKIWGNVELIPYFNILCNLAIVILLYKISLMIFKNKKLTNAVLLVFMILPSNSTIVLHAFTELPFELLTMLALYLILKSRKQILLFILCGVLLALSQWIRPLAVAWLLACIIYMFITRRRMQIIYLCLGYAFTAGVIAVATHRNFPDYICQPVTGGVNFIMGANDKATGQYCGEARIEKDGLGYLPGLRDSTQKTRVRAYIDQDYCYKYSDKYTYKECDSIFKARAIDWILDNPWKWIRLIPKKLKYTFANAPAFSYSFKETSMESKTREIVKIKAYIPMSGKIQLLAFCISFIGLFLPFWRNKSVILIVIPIIIGTAMTVATCGASRYSFIYIPNLLLFATYTSVYILERVVKNGDAILEYIQPESLQ